MAKAVKTAGYSNHVRRSERLRKQEEGDLRNAAWRSLTPEQQLTILSRRPGESIKQRARIVVRQGA